MENKNIKRGHRVFCSNRNNRKGCGKTFSILKSKIIKNHEVSTYTIWAFLMELAKGLLPFNAAKNINIDIATSTIYRLVYKIKQMIIKIRSILNINYNPAFKNDFKNIYSQTVDQLLYVFKTTNNPLSSFQLAFNTSIF